MAASMAVSTTIRVGNLFDFLVFLFLFSTSPAVEAPNAAAAAVTAATIALVIMVVEERRKQLGVLRFCAVHASFRLFVLPLSMLTLFPLFLEEEEKRHPVDDFVRQPARDHDDDEEEDEEEEAVDRNNIDADVIVIFTVLILLLLLFLYPKSSALFLKRVVHSLFNNFLITQKQVLLFDGLVFCHRVSPENPHFSLKDTIKR